MKKFPETKAISRINNNRAKSGNFNPYRPNLKVETIMYEKIGVKKMKAKATNLYVIIK